MENSPGFVTCFLADIAYKGRAKRLRLYCRDDHWHRFEANFYSEGSNIDVFDDRWHYLVHVYDPAAHNIKDQVLLYVDGVRQTLDVEQKGGVPKFSSAFNHPLVLGANDGRGEVQSYLKGSLDEVAFYVGPISEAEIVDHYKSAGSEKLGGKIPWNRH